jgi:chemotaxis protein methyltransferase CheR
MLLDEEGLLARSRIYATESVGSVLQTARSGALGTLNDGDQARWHRAGGEGSLERHVTNLSGNSEVKAHLRSAVFFAEHNLATDGPFNEFNVVLCRNVLLSFNRSLHNRVHGRLHESLGRFGVLGLGRKESLQRTPHAGEYEEIEGGGRLFRRVA